ncbi:hypothetical protein MMC27_003978 [Xylographa pallens]|nr:hypothetical protein [Xylographa pallens]
MEKVTSSLANTDTGRGATAPEWRIQDTNIGSVEDVLRKFEAMPKNHEALEVMDDIQEQIKMNRENMDFVQFRIMEIAHEKEMWKLAGETYEEYQLRWKEAFAAARTYKNSLKRGQQNRERTEKRSDLESWKDNNTKQRIYIIEDAAVEKSKAVFRVPGIR